MTSAAFSYVGARCIVELWQGRPMTPHLFLGRAVAVDQVDQGEAVVTVQIAGARHVCLAFDVVRWVRPGERPASALRSAQLTHP